MSRFLTAVFLTVFFTAFAVPSHAFNVKNHKGSYLYVMGGFKQASHDTNVRSNPDQKFGGSIIPGFGLTYGHNITDWMAPELQFSYGTATGSTPSGQGREHLLTVRLNAKYSFLTGAKFNEDKAFRIYPYVKAGGVVHGLYVNAPNTVDKVGAYGWGPGFGGGLEFNYKALYFGMDVSNDLIFLQEETNTVANTEVVITNGGFSYQASVMGCFGVHF